MLSRPRLVESINEGIRKKVLFVSAPAGFGKSTLMVEWVSQAKMPVAWISLDDNDNDPVVIFSYLIAAVQTQYPGLGESILISLSSSIPPSMKDLLIQFINQINETCDDLVLVFDDFHHITNESAIDIVNYLIEHQPTQLHMLIASRTELPFSYSRLQGQGDMQELGIRELRFNKEEVSKFLSMKLESRITNSEIAMLDLHTEGWIIGLSMAAIALQNEKNISKFIENFTGLDRFVADYLMDEVLSQQSEEHLQFLQKTSILDKITAPLCDEMLGRHNSAQILDELEKKGLFLIPLDHNRTWYSYHHLFRDLLNQRFQTTYPGQDKSLAAKACHWFSIRNELEQAIPYAIFSEDYKLAGGLIERIALKTWGRGNINILLNWLTRLPDVVFLERPELSLTLAWLYFLKGDIQKAKKNLDAMDVEKSFDNLPIDAQGDFIGKHAVMVSHIAASSHEMGKALSYAEIARSHLSPGNWLWHTLNELILAWIHEDNGDLENATLCYEQAIRLCSDREDGYFMNITAASFLCTLWLVHGEIDKTLKQCQKSILSIPSEEGHLNHIGMLHILAALALYYRGSLKEALLHVEEGLRLIGPDMDVDWILDGTLINASIYAGLGEIERAKKELLQLRELVFTSPRSETLRPRYEAYLVAMSLPDGDIKSATTWAEDIFLDNPMAPRYLLNWTNRAAYYTGYTPVIFTQGFERLLFCRLMIARKQVGHAQEMLLRWMPDFQKAHRPAEYVEALLILAIINSRLGNQEIAQRSLLQAAREAVSSGYSQVFRNEKQAIEKILKGLEDLPSSRLSGDESASLQFLIGILKDGGSPKLGQPAASRGILTKRELDVLRLIAEGFSNPEIMNKLSITNDTLRTHIKNINQKLKARSRANSITKAKDLGLI